MTLWVSNSNAVVSQARIRSLLVISDEENSAARASEAFFAAFPDEVFCHVMDMDHPNNRPAAFRRAPQMEE